MSEIISGAAAIKNETPPEYTAPQTPNQTHSPDQRFSATDLALLDIPTLARMRAAGLKRPPGVPWSHWLGLKKLNARHEYIAMMFASGMTQGQVCDKMKMSTSRMSIIARSPHMLNRIRELRTQYFGDEVASKFQQMLGPAQEFYDQVLNGNGDSKTKFKVAQDVFNRVLGKPKETIKHENHSIAELYVFLDQLQTGKKTLDVTPHSPQVEVMPTQTSLNPQDGPVRSDEFSEIDRYVDTLLPRSTDAKGQATDGKENSPG